MTRPLTPEEGRMSYIRGRGEERRTWESAFEDGERLLELCIALRLLLVGTSLEKLVHHLLELLVELSFGLTEENVVSLDARGSGDGRTRSEPCEPRGH